MKIKLSFLLFFLSGLSYSQTSVYHPFPDSNAVWNVETVALCSSAAVLTKTWNSYVIEGDTIIGLYDYHKVYIPLFFDSSQCWGNNIYPGIYFGCFRQDTLNRKVYFFERTSSTEELLYDFNLQVGDTMHGFLISKDGCTDDSVITDLDSVIINGNYRKRWKIPLTAGKEYIIEGIGYTGGPFNRICSWFESSWVLSCFTQDNLVLYSDSVYALYPGLCGIMDNVSNTYHQINNSLNPNPLINSANFYSSKFPTTLFIYNILGEKLREIKIESENTLIEKKDLIEGIYFYQVIGENNSFSSGKIVIE